MSIDLGAKPVGSTASAHLRLVVIGATGGIGRAVVDQAKQRGHDVTALIRTPEKLGSLAEKVHVIRGDPLDTEVVKRAISDIHRPARPADYDATPSSRLKEFHLFQAQADNFCGGQRPMES